MPRLPEIYFDTSVISVLTSYPSKDKKLAHWQRETAELWAQKGNLFTPVISEVVIDEIRGGNEAAAARRMATVLDLNRIEITQEVIDLGMALVSRGALPVKELSDAYHIAVCAVHQIPLLTTWDFSHINNVNKKELMKLVCQENHYSFPVILEPDRSKVIAALTSIMEQ